MPAKNTIKIYVENSYYHIYNRGVEKREIFIDEQDYKIFLGYLKEYLSPVPKSKNHTIDFTVRGKSFKGVDYIVKNYDNQIELIAYCLMPNHFHLLIKQVEGKSMELFMRSLATRYSMYFNKKYDRVGSLFQGPYKSVMIDDESYLLHLSRYIHLNAAENYNDLTKAYSSYAEYLGIRKTEWIKPHAILQYFDQTKADFIKTNSYKDFVEKYKKENNAILEGITLEN